MTSDVLKRLDEIECGKAEVGEAAAEAGLLMEQFAKVGEQIALLIERYGGSASPAIAQSLGFLLANRAQQPDIEMVGLVFAFLSKFRCYRHAEALINSLTAVQHILHYCPVGSSFQVACRSLFPFVKECLGYEGRHRAIIKGHALALLSIALSRGIIRQLFTADEVAYLQGVVQSLRLTERDELAAELSELEGF